MHSATRIGTAGCRLSATWIALSNRRAASSLFPFCRKEFAVAISSLSFDFSLLGPSLADLVFRISTFAGLSGLAVGGGLIVDLIPFSLVSPLWAAVTFK